MTDRSGRGSLEERLAALQQRVEEGLPARARALRAAAEQLGTGDRGAREDVRRHAHRLRGTAATFGHAALGDEAAAVEALARDPSVSDGTVCARAIVLAGAIERERVAAAPVAPSAAPSGLAGRRVLAVDDDEPTRRLLDLTLGTLGRSEARIVGSPEEGLALLAREPFDLVVVDAMMPSITGLEFARRAEAVGTTAKIAFLSAADHAELGWTLPEGTTWLRKPFRPRELLERLIAIVADDG